MKVAVIDPGYAHGHSHHQTVNLEINNALQNKTADVQIFCASDIDTISIIEADASNLQIFPFFKTPCYPENADSLSRRLHEVLAQSFEKELINLFEIGLILPETHLVLHTGFSFHLLGLAKAIWNLHSKIKGQVIVSMMFHPGAGYSNITDENISIWDEREYFRHKLAFKILQEAAKRSSIQTVIATPCHSYQKVYQALCKDIIVKIHPAVGHRELDESHLIQENKKPQVLLFLGGAKDDKGLRFAAHLGAKSAPLLPEVDFVFHYNNEFPGAERFKKDVDTLSLAGKEHNNVNIIYGNLSSEEYDLLIYNSTLICVLYDPAEYKFKTSGVLWDAIRNKRADYLITQTTWPALELSEMCLPYLDVEYGDVGVGVQKLQRYFNNYVVDNRGNDYPIGCNLSYLNLINSSFGGWLYNQIKQYLGVNKSCQVVQSNKNYNASKGRILVIRTGYGHFSPLSGPGGFIPHLRAQGYEVDEQLVPIGRQYLDSLPVEKQESFLNTIQNYLRSYQGNSVEIETKLQKIIANYDIVHFVDGEHTGLLTAMYKLQYKQLCKTKIVVTYHQPESIMQQIVANAVYLNGFDTIQLMSPCQFGFFEKKVAKNKLKLAHHGLAPELLYQELPLHLVGVESEPEIVDFRAAVNNRSILLTVGNWLRDFETLLATAEIMKQHKNIVFVIVSKGLSLDISHLNNVILLNEGVTDDQLHHLYLEATILFLPLEDGAANNAILESMAHGLPITTTDLPSTRHYTKDNAIFCKPEAEAYRSGIYQMLEILSINGQRESISLKLQNRAKQLVWKEVALQMSKDIYEPLILQSKEEQ